MTGPRGVAVRHLSLVGLGMTAFSLLVWSLNRRSGGLVPATSVVAVLLLVVLAALVVSAAWPVRSYLRGNRRTPLDALRAARALTIAQAAALTGSGAAGWYLGQLLVCLPDRDLTAVQARAMRLALALLASLLLVASGLVAQRMCRVDDGPRDRGKGGPPTAG